VAQDLRELPRREFRGSTTARRESCETNLLSHVTTSSRLLAVRSHAT
jgi:hypothetical protein